ncbi:MAG: hypothetical protein J6L89_08325 [Clostridia bacterium]|nr:hypothetical protein [Clostridia bacterium]
MDLNWKSIVAILLILVFGAVILNCCDSGSGSSGGKKWNDLSDQEKDNARWAYEVNQYIEDYE